LARPAGCHLERSSLQESSGEIGDHNDEFLRLDGFGGVILESRHKSPVAILGLRGSSCQ
jgi:hypothetical protein